MVATGLQPESVFNKDMQRQLLVHLYHCPGLMAFAVNSLKPTDFALPSLGIIWEVLYKFYIDHETAPNMDVLQALVQLAVKNELGEYTTYVTDAEMDAVATAYFAIQGADPKRLNEDYMRNMLPRFIKSSRQHQVIADANLTGDYSVVRQQLEQTDAAVSRLEADPTNAFVTLGEDNHGFAETAEDKLWVPTGITGLDKTLCGGMEPGQVGVVIAPTGVGKTNYMLNMAVHNAALGNDVLFVSLELHKKEILLRQSVMQGCIPGLDAKGTPLSEFPASHMIRWNAIKDPSYYCNSKITLLDCHDRRITTDMVEAYIKVWKDMPHVTRPRLVLVDWQAWLDPRDCYAKDAAEHKIIQWNNEHFGMISKREEIVLWTAMQASPESRRKSILETVDTRAGRDVHNSADLSIGINFTQDCMLKEDDRGIFTPKDVFMNWNIMKNRTGQMAAGEFYQAPTIKYYKDKPAYLAVKNAIDQCETTEHVLKLLNASCGDPYRPAIPDLKPQVGGGV